MPDRQYDVVISTRTERTSLDAQLVIVFSSVTTAFDKHHAISIKPASSSHASDLRGTPIPIHGKLARLAGPGEPLIFGDRESEVLGLQISDYQGHRIRIGYNLFSEVDFLLTHGQPIEHALVPTIERHLSLLRMWILMAGIAFVEIPPIPRGYSFVASLTHDVDFLSIRHHRFDHTFWGFLYRAVVGSLFAFIRRRNSLPRLLRNWKTVMSLPLVYLGFASDFWDQFARYVEIEKVERSTFFLIPFKNRAGDRECGESHSRRATRYDIGDVNSQIKMLEHRGFEIGLHGIDAWHSIEKAKEELKRIADIGGHDKIGIRMHWLCFDELSPSVLDKAGFEYDSTAGYNEAIGFRCGTSQVFRPLGASRLLELPLHIQDTALFFPDRLDFDENMAWAMCMKVLDIAEKSGGVVTLSWHMRSLAPERLWDGFYIRLLHDIRMRHAWIGSAVQAVNWFRGRRSVEFGTFETDGKTLQLEMKADVDKLDPGLLLRVYRPSNDYSGEMDVGARYSDMPWNGESPVAISLV